MRKQCSECPWKVKSQNNESITSHSKRLNKKHNCHMMLSKNDSNSLWDVKKDYICIGARENIK